MNLFDTIKKSHISGNGNLMQQFRISRYIVTSFVIVLSLFAGVQKVEAAEKDSFSKNSKYYFDGSISRKILENYLDRSGTMGYFLVHGTPENYKFPYREDDVRMIKNIGIKFIGRAIYRWGPGKLV